MKKIKILLGISLLVGMFLMSCEKESSNIGGLINHTDCKDFSLKNTHINDYGTDTSCVMYSYNSQDKKLNLKHINAGFNCCPDKLFCEIDILADTVRIEEREKDALCSCNCLFDLDIVVNNIELEKYYIIFDEPYCGDQDKIMFEIDLTKDITGKFCVHRTVYPWGI